MVEKELLKMCKRHQRILSQTKQGFIINCSKCNSFMLVFGTIGFSLKFADIKILNSRIQDYCDDEHASLDPARKLLHIKTPCTGTSLILSLNELIELQEILNQALLWLELDDILNS